MVNRVGLGALLLVGCVATSIGCSSNGLDSITVSPTVQTVTLCGAGVTGAPVQFTAIGTYNHGTHPATHQDLTSLATWTSNVPAIGTVDSSGLATVTSSSNGVSGSTIITATMEGYGGPVSGSATLTKVITTTCAAARLEVPRLDRE